jgi:hypothetical protein
MESTEICIERVQSSNRDSDNLARLNTLISSLRLTTALKSTLELGVPQILNTSPQNISALSKITQTLPSKLHRLLRILSHFGYYKYDTSSQTWSNSELSSMFLGDIKYYLLWESNPLSINLPKLVARIISEPIHMRIIFEDAFSIESAMKDPTLLAVFQTSLIHTCDATASILTGRVNLSEYSNIIDIGGGAGAMLKFFLEENPHMKGTVFDLEVLRHFTENYIRSQHVKNRMSFVSGDFFEFIPKNYDVHLMKNILHDWGDDQAKLILQRSREAINPKGILIIIEMLTSDEDAYNKLAKLDDFKMVGLLGGKARSVHEYHTLLLASGYRISKIQESDNFFSAIYAEPFVEYPPA